VTVSAGTVQFFDGGSPIGAAQTVSSTGVATLDRSFTTTGTHLITAQYTGTGSFDNSPVSPQASLAVNLATTTIAIAASQSTAGGKVTIAVTITPTSYGAYSGSAHLIRNSDGVQLDVQTVASSNPNNGTVTLTAAAGALLPGNDSITVTFDGGGNYAASTLTQTIAVA
jgi:hypothetical protein